MQPLRFLAIHPLPHEGDARERLARVASAAHERGVHAIETLWSEGRGRAYTLVEAESVDGVRRAFEEAGLTALDVFPCERIHTDLLAEPRRNQ